ncbi:hypothetical protein ABIA32_002430 [Streptacidiphilus sp. MAP12-20]|uniref:DUF6412 domain-containing protein n=1 Tax=Streptacidiphilus sp. MAP12-20 TaxID=3156299 RepID=UPI003514D842
MQPITAALGPAGLLWQLLAHVLTGPGVLPAAAAATALVLLAGVVGAAMVVAGALALRLPLSARDRALRMRARHTAFLPQRDPDARGRSRPRAPSARPAAASLSPG